MHRRSPRLRRYWNRRLLHRPCNAVPRRDRRRHVSQSRLPSTSTDMRVSRATPSVHRRLPLRMLPMRRRLRLSRTLFRRSRPMRLRLLNSGLRRLLGSSKRRPSRANERAYNHRAEPIFKSEAAATECFLSPTVKPSDFDHSSEPFYTKDNRFCFCRCSCISCCHSRREPASAFAVACSPPRPLRRSSATSAFVFAVASGVV